MPAHLGSALRRGYRRPVSRRTVATLGLGALLAAAYPGVAAAGSMLVRSERADRAFIDGVGCGVAASAVVPLPTSARDMEVRRPRVGATTPESRLTEAAVAGTSVRFTAVGEGVDVCDPGEDPDVPPAERQWSGAYDYRILFRERVSGRYFAGVGSGRRLRSRPRRVTIPFVADVVRIRWRSFGGRRAIGFGRMRVDEPPGFDCTARTCPGHGSRFEVRLTRPSRCRDLGDAVFYGRVAFHTTKRIGVIRRGRLFASVDPRCGSGDPQPV